MAPTTVVFDWDGTLVDSDEALIAPFVALGVPREQITFGHPVRAECTRLGISAEAYLEGYDAALVRPWPGIVELVAAIEQHGRRWAVCSNKHPGAGAAELSRLGWQPEGVWWSDAFAGEPKRLGPVLDGLELDPAEVLFVGDTEHDRHCAEQAGVAMVLAGWNPRASVSGVPVVRRPLDVLDLLG